MNGTSTVTGKLPNQVANDISDAIHAALERGMETDEACCVALRVVADYARMEYGAGYLTKLAALIVQFADAPFPEDIGRG